MLKIPRIFVASLAAAFALLLSLTAGSTAVAQTPHDRDLSAPADQPSALMAASALSSNSRALYLKFPTDAGAQACKSRDIYLAAGWYGWQQILNPPESGWVDYNPRKIYLAAGWYHWKDCVGALSQGGYTYYHDTYLRKKSTGGYATLPRDTFNSTSRGTFYVHFGSNLWQL